MSEKTLDPVKKSDPHTTELEAGPDKSNLSPTEVQELSEKYGIPIETLKEVIADISESQTERS